jgi:hypothetical protein
MLLLRLVGIDMSDEAAETFGGGIRAFLGAGGFISMLAGEEVIREGGALWVGVGLIVIGLPIFLLPFFWKRLFDRHKKPTKLEYLSYEDSELGSAIRDMVWRSVEAKAYAAQYIALNDHLPISEADLMHWADSRIWDQLKNGELQARGRKPGRLEYEPIPQTHWRSTFPHMIPDNRTLWKMILAPTGGAEFTPDGIVLAHDQNSKERTDQLAEYDSIIVDARQFEALWPRKDKRLNAIKFRHIKTAKKAGADPAEIQKLLQE